MHVTEFVESVGVNIPRHVSANEFLSLAREGMIEKKHLRTYALSDFHSQEAQCAAYGLLISRYPQEVPVGFFSFAVQRVAVARRRLVAQLAPALDLSLDDLRKTPPPEPVRRFTEFVSWAALHAGPGEAALLVRTDVALWSHSCSVLVDFLSEAQYAPEAAVEYFGAHQESPGEIADGALEVIESGRSLGEPAEWIARSARRAEPVRRSWWRAVATGG
ncbi:hypothetical protein [Streptomyces ziwulingensis]|uniref:Uncharacterized protein n=1 Tax=Streptomyces ziwulingensis TaxID=1045501 RepID=A0ABP9CNB0_9ACTN